MKEENNAYSCTRLEIPMKTYLRLIFVIVSVYFLYVLSPLILLLFLSLLVSMTLVSVENYLMRKGWKKITADSFLILTLVAVIGSIFFLVLPEAVSQMRVLLQHAPTLKKEITSMAPVELQSSAGKLFSNSPASVSRIWTQVGEVANHTLTGIFETGVMLIAAVYMFLDGRRTYAWITAFFSAPTRKKIDTTAEEIRPIVESYIIGQATTSLIAALWVFTVATILGIPGAMILAVLAAVFDILPGIGIIMNIIVSGLLALAVSLNAALIMMASLVAYSLIENYILIPHIYGHRMKLSPLVVLLSIIVSGTFAGIPGMIAILPIVAAYGPIERNWLKRDENFKESVLIHEKLEREEPGHFPS